MALQRNTVSAPACTSFNSLTSSLTAVASSAAVTVGVSANVTDHEITVTLACPESMTGSASTVVNLFAYGSADGSTWAGMNANSGNIELIDGTDKTITLDADGNNARYLGSVAMPVTTAGTSITCKSQPLSISAAFGGSMPSKYVILAQNQAGATLPASGHSIGIQEISYN